MEMTYNPRSVAKAETFQSLSLTTGFDYHLFTGSSVLSVCRGRPLGHSNHSKHPERLPSGRVLKAAEKRERKKKEGESVGVRRVSDTERVPGPLAERCR